MPGKDYRYRQCDWCDRFKDWKNTNAVRHMWRETWRTQTAWHGLQRMVGETHDIL